MAAPATEGLELYTYLTANGMKVSVCLEELGLPFKANKVDLTKGQQKEGWFLKLNPAGRIPVLVDHDAGGLVLFESAAIVYYLATAKDTQHRLLPDSPAAAAEVIQWLSFQTSYMAEPTAALYVPLVAGGPGDAGSVRRAVQKLAWCWNILEAHLAKRRGWLVGDGFTAADAAFVGGMLQHAALLDVVFSPQRYPAVTSWLQGMVQREGVRRGLQVLDPNPLLAAGEERDKVVNKAHERLAAMGLTQDALTAEP